MPDNGPSINRQTNNNPTSASWPVSRACARSCLWTARCKSPAAPSAAGSRSTACTGGLGRRRGAGGGEGGGLRGAGGPRPGKRGKCFFGVFPRAQHTPSHMAPLLTTHLCDLEAGYGVIWLPNFGGASPGFQPRTSCMRVRSRSHYAIGAAPWGKCVNEISIGFYIFLLQSCLLDQILRSSVKNSSFWRSLEDFSTISTFFTSRKDPSGYFECCAPCLLLLLCVIFPPDRTKSTFYVLLPIILEKTLFICSPFLPPFPRPNPAPPLPLPPPSSP